MRLVDFYFQNGVLKPCQVLCLKNRRLLRFRSSKYAIRSNQKKESVLTNQLIRSGTSIGANIREAFYAHGRADFIAKLQIALKECSESEYWLELLIESGYYDDSSVLAQCTEIKKMLISSINTARSNSK